LHSLSETGRRQGKKPLHFLLNLFTKNTQQARLISTAIPSRKNLRHRFVAETGGSKIGGSKELN
jgi:hypothetical protein